MLAGEVAVGAVLVFHPGRGPVTTELLVLGAVGRGGQVCTALVSGKEQKKLIELFHEGNNFIDRQVHQKLLDSAKKYGDLRGRKLALTPLSLPVSSFYTRAFGGVYLLRDFIKDIMIFEDEKL